MSGNSYDKDVIPGPPPLPPEEKAKAEAKSPEAPAKKGLPPKKA